VPLTSDPEAAVRRIAVALPSFELSAEETARRLPGLAESVRSGDAPGALLADGERTVGVALWDPTSPLGLTLELLALDVGEQTVARYTEALDAIGGSGGPVAFAPGIWPGVPGPEQGRAMAARGFTPFARSEMRYPADRPPPSGAAPAGVTLRPVTEEDRGPLAALHARAYRGLLDRYLFYRDPDDARDAAQLVGELFDGQWGPPRLDCSVAAEDGGRLVAATFLVDAPYGPLIADVMVDPAERGRGLGRAVLGRSLVALRAAGETVAVLNVTDENVPALRLYESIGFVRSLGPSPGWYDRGRVPLVPSA